MFFNRKKSRKIDFIIIGTQKGGTTALDYYLRQHQEIGMAKLKEVHFFDDEDAFSAKNVDYSKYESQFDFKPLIKVYGEATPIYLYWDQCCKRIWQYNSKIKLIIILRNPIERAYSHWNMEYDRKSETEDFLFCIKNESERSKVALPLQHRTFSYVDRGFYSEQIRRYKRFFDDTQLLFIKYDDFKNNQEFELGRIFNFLNITAVNYIFKKETVYAIPQQKGISKEESTYLLNIYKNDIAEVERLLNWDCSDWIRKYSN